MSTLRLDRLHAAGTFTRQRRRTSEGLPGPVVAVLFTLVVVAGLVGLLKLLA